MTSIVPKKEGIFPDIYIEQIAKGKRVKIVNHKEEQKKGHLRIWAEVWALDDSKKELWFKAEDGSVYKNFYYQRALTRDEIFNNVFPYYKKHPELIFNPKYEK